MTREQQYRLIAECLVQRKPPRCAECPEYGKDVCPQTIEALPVGRPAPIRSEETMEMRVRRLFATV
jgi:hypothetical protein